MRVLRLKRLARGIGHMRVDVEDGEVLAKRAHALQCGVDPRAVVDGGEDLVVRGSNRRMRADLIQTDGREVGIVGEDTREAVTIAPVLRSDVRRDQRAQLGLNLWCNVHIIT